MEKIMTIQRVMPVNERQYNDKNGAQQNFVSRGLLLTDGIDTMYAEIVGDNARRTDLKDGLTCNFSMSVTCRRWEDKNHQERYSNDITIHRIGL